MMIELSEQQIIDDLSNKLAGVHTHVEPEAVAKIVQAEYERFDGRPIRDFIPLLVERNATRLLAGLVPSLN